MIFGHVENVAIGDVFDSREHLSKVGVHGPLVAGIWGATEGASSIVLSGGYEDDIDELSYILYTGQGGQDVSSGKQVSDQEFVRGNKGLKLSHQYRLPVRVTRGHQIKNGPLKGYRYDGLYYVTAFEKVKGKRGYYICRFHLSSESNIEELEGKLDGSLKSEYSSTKRSSTTIYRIKRNISLSEKIKTIYECRCQVCDVVLDTPCGPVAIAGHIKALGKPHDGPDVMENMLCLCPNHHEQFDKYAFYIEPENLSIVGLDGFEGKKLAFSNKHHIGKEFLEYQYQQYQRIN